MTSVGGYSHIHDTCTSKTRVLAEGIMTSGNRVERTIS